MSAPAFNRTVYIPSSGAFSPRAVGYGPFWLVGFDGFELSGNAFRAYVSCTPLLEFNIRLL